MKSFLASLFFLLFFFQSSNAQQSYLIDSTTTIALFGGSSGGVFTTKYAYDDNLRLISELSEYSDITYEYLAGNDYVKRYNILQSGIIANETTYTHNDDGLIIEEFFRQYDYQAEQLYDASRRVYERDEEQRLVSDQFYSFNNSNQQVLTQKRTYEYNEFGLSEESYTHYNINGGSVYLQTEIQYLYENDRLTKVNTQNIYTNQTNHSVKEFTYDQDKLISTEEVYFTNAQPGYSYLYNYEYTDEGIFIHQFSKFDNNSDYVAGSSEYKSTDETPFYEFDTLLFSFQFEGEIFEEQKNFNSVHYTTTEDTAIVRRVIENSGFEGQNFIQISKEIYLRYGEPVDTSIIPLDVANIYPNPVAADNPIKLESLDKNITSYRILNYLGQSIKNESIWNHENQAIQAPSIPGNYLIQFYSENEAYGSIYKIMVF